MQLTVIFVGLSAVFFLASVFFIYRYFRSRETIARLEAQKLDESLMTERFQSIAQNVLRTSTEDFLKIAQASISKQQAEGKSDLEKKQLEIKQLLQPIQHTLDEYRSELKILETARQKSYNDIDSELRRVIELSGSLARETSALKNALKRPHVRGRWGEVQLKNCVELAGMSEFSDVTFQDMQDSTDGQRMIPDLTVRMPGNRMIIVDAKSPIDAFLDYLEAIDDDSRRAELLKHGKHVKEHVRKLATRAYSEGLKNTADFVVMFLPNESFLYAALESEPDLIEFALQKKILIATPPTLIGLLKVIRYGWNEERLAENAEKISSAGQELHKRLCDFVETYSNVGKHLDKAKIEFDAGLMRLQSRVIVQAKRLETLGAKSHKELPESTITTDGGL